MEGDTENETDAVERMEELDGIALTDLDDSADEVERQRGRRPSRQPSGETAGNPPA